MRKQIFTKALPAIGLAAVGSTAAIAAPTDLWWDVNGTTSGGGISGVANGDWSNASANWNTKSDGTATPVVYSGTYYYSNLYFSAGSDVASANVNLSPSNSNANSLTFEEGSVQITTTANKSFSLTDNGTGNANTGKITVGSNLTATIAVNIGSGSLALKKYGQGELILQGANSYNRQVEVFEGILRIDAAGHVNSSTGITVNGASAKLLTTAVANVNKPITLTQGAVGGTGTFSTALTVGANGVVEPGLGVTGSKGTLRFANSLDLAGGTTKLELFGADANNSDKVVQSSIGTITFGGTLDVTKIGAWAAVDGTKYDLFDWIGSPTGTFTQVNLPSLGAGTSWKVFDATKTNGNQYIDWSTGEIQVVVPEPASAALLLLPAAAMLARRRRFA